MKVGQKTLAVLGSAFFSYCILSQSAHAVPISGSIGFHGGATITQAGGTSTLTFTNPLQVDIRMGDYNGIPSGTPVALAPISWTGSGLSAVLVSNNSPEWTINFGGSIYQYSILALQAAFVDTTSGAFSLQGAGFGTISGAINREPTSSTFSIQGIGSQVTFTIVQASGCGCGIPRATPDGGSAIALLGLATAGLEVLRRTRVKLS
jgi:hypothetical protein